MTSTENVRKRVVLLGVRVGSVMPARTWYVSNNTISGV
jgi:hypothetical protein